MTDDIVVVVVDCWSGPKVETTDEIDEKFIEDFYTTSNTVRENKYGRKLLKEF